MLAGALPYVTTGAGTGENGILTVDAGEECERLEYRGITEGLLRSVITTI
jgi:hypothetical protein